MLFLTLYKSDPLILYIYKPNKYQGHAVPHPPTLGMSVDLHNINPHGKIHNLD